MKDSLEVFLSLIHDNFGVLMFGLELLHPSREGRIRYTLSIYTKAPITLGVRI